MKNISKLLLTAIMGTTVSIASLSATESVEKIQAFQNVPTQALSVEDLKLVGEYRLHRTDPLDFLKDKGNRGPIFGRGCTIIGMCSGELL